MKIPTRFTVMDRATASRKLFPRAFMARWEENSFSAARPEKLPSGKNVAIRIFTLGHTRNAAMNQVSRAPTTRTNGERTMLRAVDPLMAVVPPGPPAPRRYLPRGGTAECVQAGDTQWQGFPAPVAARRPPGGEGGYPRRGCAPHSGCAGRGRYAIPPFRE